MRLHQALTVAALLVAMVVVGCGGDDGDQAAAPDRAAGQDLGLLDDGMLVVATDIPFPPFVQGDPPDYEGFDIDVINAVADEIGLETEIRDLPFDVILQGQSGRFDLAIASVTITPERERSVDFSHPYFEAEQGLLVPADGSIQSADDLTGDTVVGVADGSVAEEYVKENTDARLRPFPEIDDAYNAVANGQVDAVVNDVSSEQAALEKYPKLAVPEAFATGELIGIIVPQGNGPLLDAVNAGVEAVKENGTLAELYRKWFDKPPSELLLDARHNAT